MELSFLDAIQVDGAAFGLRESNINETCSIDSAMCSSAGIVVH